MFFLPHRKRALSCRFSTPSFLFTFKNAVNEARRWSTFRSTKSQKDKGTVVLVPEADALATAGKHFYDGAKLPSIIARMWITASSNKMLQPHHVSPRSKKLVNWRCPHCICSFSRPIYQQVEMGGQCPRCHLFPGAKKRRTGSTTRSIRDSEAASFVYTPTRPPLRLSPTFSPQRRTDAIGRNKQGKPNQSLLTVKTAVNASPAFTSLKELAVKSSSRRAPKSVADGQYLKQEERRILLPMLAKKFENEIEKIDPVETLFVSPKLDGIRCVVSFNKRSKKLLFFSRAGNLFECCDQYIEPFLRPLFETDPNLVLDGELYNDFSNLKRAQQRLSENKQSVLRYWFPSSLTFPSRRRKKNVSLRLGYAEGSTKEEEPIVFDDLVSAVRTTRAKRTPEVLQLQRRLQYHVFDVLYSSSLSCSRAPFSERWQLLHDLYRYQIKDTHKAKTHLFPFLVLPGKELQEKRPQDIIRLVPYLQCTLLDVDSVLHEAMLAGYEGVMVRRDRTAPVTNQTKPTSDVSCGYHYGQRSSTLLKYKQMKDDEFVIVDVAEGKGKWKGCLGAFICLTHGSKKMMFSVSPAISEVQKRRLWSENRAAELIGKALTVQFQELTSDGVPRFPVGKAIRGSESKVDWI